MAKPKVPPQHRTLGAHVSEALWQTAHYQAVVDRVSTSELVKEAVALYLSNRGVPIATYGQLVGRAQSPTEPLEGGE